MKAKKTDRYGVCSQALMAVWERKMRRSCCVSLLLAAASFGAQSVSAATIDFESFVAGDDLATVNAVTAPLGAIFDAAFPGSFQVINDSGNNIVESQTFPPEFDLIVNFSAPVDFVQIEFVDNPEGIDLDVFLAVFDVPITTLDMIPTVDFLPGTEPNVFSSSVGGIRAIAMESGSGTIRIDNLTFQFAPGHQSIVSADDPIFGPGALTMDMGTGLLWLDPTFTIGRSFNDVSAQLVAGGEFEGFRYATENEVLTFLSNAGIPDIPGTSAANFAPIQALHALTGTTDSGGTFVLGITSSLNASNNHITVFAQLSGADGVVDLSFTSPDSMNFASGSWLVKSPDLSNPGAGVTYVFNDEPLEASFDSVIIGTLVGPAPIESIDFNITVDYTTFAGGVGSSGSRFLLEIFRQPGEFAAVEIGTFGLVPGEATCPEIVECDFDLMFGNTPGTFTASGTITEFADATPLSSVMINGPEQWNVSLATFTDNFDPAGPEGVINGFVTINQRPSVATPYEFTRLVTSLPDTGLGRFILSGRGVTINNAGDVAYAFFDTVTRQNFLVLDDGFNDEEVINLNPSLGFEFFVGRKTFINDQGAVAMTADAQFTSNGVVIRVNPDRTVTILATYNGDGVSGNYMSIRDGELAMNNAGQVAALARLNSGEDAVVLLDDSGQSLIDSAPARINFNGVALNDAGVVAYKAQGEPDFLPNIFTGDGTSVQLAVPLPIDGATGIGPDINESGLVAGASGRSLVLGMNGMVTEVVVDSTASPFTEAQIPSLNNLGQVLFSTGINSTDGLFFGDDPATDKLIQTGDLLFGDPVLSGFRQRFGGGFGANGAFNDQGQAVFVISTLASDGSQTSYLLRADPVPPPVDSDGDGIEDAIDGTLNGVFNDQSTVFSNDFTDQHLGGFTFGSIVARNNNIIAVTDDRTDGVILAATGGTGTTEIQTCTNPVANNLLTHGDEITITCGSFIGEVLAGPVVVNVGMNIGVTIPADAIAFIEELPGSILSISHLGETGSPNIVIIDNGTVTNLGPDDPPVMTTLDADDDGVPDASDQCADTLIPESVPTVMLKPNRWALTDDDFDFDTVIKGKGPNRSYSTANTAGCSCEQIIAAQGLGKGHSKFGCSIGVMDDWISLVNP